MHNTRLLLVVIINLIILTGCTANNYIIKKISTEKIAREAGFQPVYFNTKLFQIYGWKKRTAQSNKKLIIYIEGDGRAWKTRFKVSNNPTPQKAMSLHLAVQDKYSNILYLARPCQFIDAQRTPSCQKKYWTSHRYSQEVLDSYLSILDQVREKNPMIQIELVGYSGGGVIAALLAGQRNDVHKITTVAANLDHLAWTQYHNISPLSGSLNLYSNNLDFSTVIQVHLWGAKDSIVPYKINTNLINTKLRNNNYSSYIYKLFDHSCCWIENWNNIIYNE